MKNFFDEYKEFIYSCISIVLGTTIGFVGARFINEKLSNRAFYHCPAKNLVFMQNSMMGGKYICLKK